MQIARLIRSFRELDGRHEPARLASKVSGRGAVGALAGIGKAALSIDVEDWFQTANLEGVIARTGWDECELRVERNTMRMIEILAARNARATFFVLGWVAERCPQLVREIAAAGHEVASHGYNHELVYSLQPSAFRSDVMHSKQCLEDLTGKPVRGYRAPCFSITEWAIPILYDLGFDYDSSFVPSIAHDRYGKLNGIPDGQAIVPLRDGFYEVCISCIRAGKHGIPWGGGGYFRLLPYWLWRQGVGMILRSGVPYVFYIHPWEIDERQPHVAGMRRSDAFRQHVNLQRCEQRFSALVSELEWRTLSELVDEHHSAVQPSATRRAVRADPHRGPTESARI